MRVFNPRKLRYATVLDSVARLVFRLGRMTRPGRLAPASPPDPRQILVLESHLIGDIVMAIPALRALRERFRSANITFVAGPWGKVLLADQGLVNDFVEIRFPWSTYDYSPSNLRRLMSAVLGIRRRHWDLAIDLRGDIRNIAILYLTGATRRVSYGFTGGEYLLSDIVTDPAAKEHIVDHNIHLVEQLGCAVTLKEPALKVSEQQMGEARNVLQLPRADGGVAVIGIHPGASKPLRHWSADRFAKLADILLENTKHRVFLFQGPKDRQTVMDIVGKMKHPAAIIEQPLSLLPALFKCCNVLVGLDSGAVHLAAAVGTPTIVLFGPAEPEKVRPYSGRSLTLIKEGYSCRPCDQVHCVQPGNNCMDALQVETVYQQLMDSMMKWTRDCAVKGHGAPAPDGSIQ
jgi:lipopolysaccharide heptosyltransferase II